MSKDYSKIQAKNNMEVSRNAEVESDSVQSEERPKLQSVVGVVPKKIKRSLFSRLVSGLVGPEGLAGLGGQISEEIVKPAIKNIIWDSVMSGLGKAMYGDRGFPGHGGRGPYGDGRPRTQYNNAYNNARPSNDRGNVDRYGFPKEGEPRSNVISRTSHYGVEEYIITDRYDAAQVLTTLTECADRYGMVSVADYYDLIKVSSNFTDNSYGWNHEVISTARIVPIRGGYVIKFPPVEVL